MSLKQRQDNQTHHTEPSEVKVRSGSGNPPATDSNVLVSYGTHHTPFPIRGLSIRQARESLARLMNIDETAVPVINGTLVEEDTMIDEQVTLLSFVKPASIRGCRQ
jgi:hypothetical protein